MVLQADKFFDDLEIIDNLDKKEVEFSFETYEQSLEHTVGLVHSVAKISIIAEIHMEASAGNLSDAEINPLKWINITPNGMIPAFDVSGKLALELMKSKIPGDNIVDDEGSTSRNLTAIYSFDMRDYMAMWELGLPEEAKDIYLKLTIPKQSDLYSGGATVTWANCNAKITIQVEMDEYSDYAIGYRRYFEENIGLDSKDSNKCKKIKLTRSGFLDSLLIYNPNSLPITDIRVVKDEVSFPVKSTWTLEKMKTLLMHNKFRSDIIMIDLVRPVDAEMSGSLRLELEIGEITEVKSLYIVNEYVHLDKNLMAKI